MSELDDLVFRPVQPEDQNAVKTLILNGLVDHWGTLDTTKNPDLNNIAESYAGAIFLVACDGDEIVATGACIPRSERQAEIVRMSVKRELRRKGLGKRMLENLLNQARRSGFEQIILETTETWTDVIAFYQQFGFKITHYQDGDVYFSLDLN